MEIQGLLKAEVTCKSMYLIGQFKKAFVLESIPYKSKITITIKTKIPYFLFF